MARVEAIAPPEVLSRRFVSAIYAGVYQGLEKVTDRFEQWPYHRPHHTRAVIERTSAILTTIRQADTAAVSERDVLLGQLAAAFHDTVQNFTLLGTPDGRMMMKRAVGDNENASAQEAETFMRSANVAADDKIFTEDDIRTVREAILGTVPGWSQELKTVVQPNVTSDSSTVARAVALADLGASGMDPATAVEEGDRVFMEENYDMLQALYGSEPISDEQKEFFRTRMVTWATQQIEFITGRKNLFESQIQGFSPAIQERLRSLFSGFNQSIALQRRTAESRTQMTFEQIAADMGYPTHTFSPH